jgi:selT/selW/selH-like putative selenoprotein
VYPDAEIRLLESSGGLFEVTVDGTLVFSKKATRRHAQPGEVLQAIQQVRGEVTHAHRHLHRRR